MVKWKEAVFLYPYILQYNQIASQTTIFRLKVIISSKPYSGPCIIQSLADNSFRAHISFFALPVFSTFLRIVLCVCITEEVDVDVEGTDYLLGDLEWSTSSVSDSDERGSLRSSCSDEGYSSASLLHLANSQEKSPTLGCSL